MVTECFFVFFFLFHRLIINEWDCLRRLAVCFRLLTKAIVFGGSSGRWGSSEAAAPGLEAEALHPFRPERHHAAAAGSRDARRQPNCASTACAAAAPAEWRNATGTADRPIASKRGRDLAKETLLVTLWWLRLCSMPPLKDLHDVPIITSYLFNYFLKCRT